MSPTYFNKCTKKHRKQPEVSKLGTTTPGCLKANPAKESSPMLMLDTGFVREASELSLFLRKTFHGSYNSAVCP